MYVYNDEDNAPMNEDPFTGAHNPTIYNSRAEMKAAENPEPEKPADGCWNCINFNWMHEACTLNWNNMDESYYNPEIDDRQYTDCCEDHETDPDVDPADWFELGGNEP